MYIESVMLSNRLILCLPLLLPSIPPSTRIFSSESAFCIRWPKYRSFSFSIIPSSEYSGLISFRIDWFDFLSVQGALKSLLQHHNWRHQFFNAQPSLWSNSHIHTQVLEKPKLWLCIPLSAKWYTVYICHGFSPKEQGSLWMVAVTLHSDLEPKKIKPVTVSIVSSSICHEVMGPDAMILVFLMLSFKPTFSFSLSVIIK